MSNPYQPPSSDPYGQQPSHPYPTSAYSQPSSDPYSQPSTDPYGQGSANSYSEPANPYEQANPYPTAGYGAATPYPNPYGVVSQEHPQAVVILVLGILGFVTNGITGVIALILGNKPRKEVRDHPGKYSNGSLITVGWVLGLVTTIIGGIGLLFLVAYVIIAVVLFSNGSY